MSNSTYAFRCPNCEHDTLVQREVVYEYRYIEVFENGKEILLEPADVCDTVRKEDEYPVFLCEKCRYQLPHMLIEDLFGYLQSHNLLIVTNE